MTIYIAFDIGCIECGEPSAVLGAFKTKRSAQKICNEHRERQQDEWHGQHYFEVFSLERIGKTQRVEYS